MEAEITNLVERFERGRLTRRQLIGRLTGLAAAMSAAPAAAALGPKGKNATFKATDVNHVALTVTDIARSRAFYEEHLDVSVDVPIRSQREGGHPVQQGPRQCSLARTLVFIVRKLV